MKTKTLKLTGCTVGELKAALENIQDDTYINIANVGNTGIVKAVDIDITEGKKESRVCINIEAEGVTKF